MSSEKPTLRVFEMLEQIGRPAVRRSFQADPLRTLQSIGLDANDLPESVLDALSEMSDSELSAVARIVSLVRQHDSPTAASAKKA